MFIKEAQAQELGKIDTSLIRGLQTDAGQIISALIQLALAASGLIFLAMLVLGGLKYLTAGGDEKAVSSARQTLSQAFIGLVIIVSAFLVAQLLFNIFDLKGIIQLRNKNE